MAYDEALAARIRKLVDATSGVTEKKMFGGLAFLLDGHMACGVVRDELMVRVGKDGWRDALARPHVREMDFTGRSLKGFVYVGTQGVASDRDLAAWLERALAHAAALPAKP